MIKKIIYLLLVSAFGLSLFTNWRLLDEYINVDYTESLPSFNEQEGDLLLSAYKELSNEGVYLFYLYPYKIEYEKDAYWVKFQILDHLRSGNSMFSSPIIFDGCVYFKFSLSHDLQERVDCG